MKIHLVTAVSFVLFASLFSFNEVKAQHAASDKSMPPFRILLTNMKYLNATDLDKNKPAMILYFDPTCDHCIAFIVDMLKHNKEFAKTQVIMISYTPVSEIKKFETEFSLANYPNIKIGTEGNSFIVQRFYNIQRFPFVALFNKNGTLVASYHEPSGVQAILPMLKKM